MTTTVTPHRGQFLVSVSRWFRFDWNYILATGRLPAFKPTAIVLAVMPILANVATFIPIINTSHFWLLWAASISSLIAFVVTRICCPPFIREYESYDAYEKKGHSHRWIIWNFHLARKDFSNQDNVISETIENGLTIPTASQ
jgi:hypothetical protein